MTDNHILPLLDYGVHVWHTYLSMNRNVSWIFTPVKIFLLGWKYAFLGAVGNFKNKLLVYLRDVNNPTYMILYPTQWWYFQSVKLNIWTSGKNSHGVRIARDNLSNEFVTYWTSYQIDARESTYTCIYIHVLFWRNYFPILAKLTDYFNRDEPHYFDWYATVIKINMSHIYRADGVLLDTVDLDTSSGMLLTKYNVLNIT
jgi:hypothetical protein